MDRQHSSQTPSRAGSPNRVPRSNSNRSLADSPGARLRLALSSLGSSFRTGHKQTRWRAFFQCSDGKLVLCAGGGKLGQCTRCQKPVKASSKHSCRPARARRRLFAWSLPFLCKTVLLAGGLLLALHALSCGLFFCIRLPWMLDLSSDASQELYGLYGLSGTLALSAISFCRG